MWSAPIYKTRIEDALERDLSVVISLWGSGQWASKPKEGIQEFVETWGRLAKYYQDYPEGLVFDLWNEPAGLLVQNGKPVGITDGETAMEYLNAVIPVIRKTNPGRTLGIGGPGLNGCRELEQRRIREDIRGQKCRPERSDRAQGRSHEIQPCGSLPANSNEEGEPSGQVPDLREKGKALQNLLPG